MKKSVIIIILIIILINLFTNNVEKTFIPGEAFRFRIIASSDSIEDQEMKIKIRNDIFNILNEKYKNTETLLEAKSNALEIKGEIENKILSYSDNYNIVIGENYFPEKEYKSVKYKSGYYDSMVVTLGEGLGSNWWCVLFPPLCLIDAEEDTTENVEYHFFIFDWINDLLG